MKWINIHTHSHQSAAFEIIDVAYEHPSQQLEFLHCSLSFHPCHLKTNYDWNEISKMIENNKNILAIGESGLDKGSAFSMDYQISVLDQSYLIAKKYQLPLIIHCVSAFDILLSWKKDKNHPMIIHGFRKNKTLLKQLIDKGFYISGGVHLLKGSISNDHWIHHVPMNRLFLETDNEDQVQIESLYHCVSSVLGISLPEFQEIIYNNYIRIFNGRNESKQ